VIREVYLPFRTTSSGYCFPLIQAAYLIFYIVSLGRLCVLGEILTVGENLAHIVLVMVIVTAPWDTDSTLFTGGDCLQVSQSELEISKALLVSSRP
jgi:hypothetical protein